MVRFLVVGRWVYFKTRPEKLVSSNFSLQLWINCCTCVCRRKVRANERAREWVKTVIFRLSRSQGNRTVTQRHFGRHKRQRRCAASLLSRHGTVRFGIHLKENNNTRRPRLAIKHTRARSGGARSWLLCQHGFKLKKSNWIYFHRFFLHEPYKKTALGFWLMIRWFLGESFMEFIAQEGVCRCCSGPQLPFMTLTRV